MSDQELATLLREAEPPRHQAPDDIGALWSAGRRRTRRTRAVWLGATAAAAVVVIGTVVGVVGGRNDAQTLDVAGPTPATDVPVDARPDPVLPEPGPDAPDGASNPVAVGFPVTMRMNRTGFVVGGEAEAEIGFAAPVEDPVPVTVAIPFTIDAWDPATETWSPTTDLYDMSRAASPSWQPHGTRPAWYQRTTFSVGFPVVLPTQDLAPGSYRVCAQAWRTADDLVQPDDEEARVFGDAADLSSLLIPDSVERLCVAISMSAGDTSPTAAELAAAPHLEIPRLGLLAPILPATVNNLSAAVGLIDGTPRPGDPGMSVIVGHRTTWMADFRNIDQLQPGDRFAVIDADRRVDVEVVGTRIVQAGGPVEAPTFGIPAAELARPRFGEQPSARVRLVTFNPTYSAAERLIVDAVVTGTSE